MVFFAYILFGVLQKKIYLKDSVKLVAAPVGIILSFFGIRYLVFGKTVLDGTGGVALYDTFNIAGIIKFIMKQILYVFGGINAENEEYLNGIDPRNVHLFIYLCSAVFVGSTIVVVICFLKRNLGRIYELGIFMLAIGCAIVSSSVTIRVEMRWLYVSYALWLLAIVYMIGVFDYKKEKMHIVTILVSCVTILVLLQECYYRQYWNNLYYWGERQLSSSFFEYVDKEEIGTVTIVDVGGQLSWDQAYIESLCEPYGIHIQEVFIVDSIAGIEWDSELILMLKNGEYEFVDITRICMNK